jgi:hypothetical protein
MGSNLTTVAFIYKRKYDDGKVGDIASRAHPTMKMVAKSDGMSGPAQGWYYGIRYGNPQGISGEFATAQSNASGSSGVQMAASRVKKYGVIQLDGEALMAAKDKGGALLELVTQETDGIIEELGDGLGFELFRDGTAARGRRSSVTGDVVTLTVADDARNFKKGMVVIASANADGSTPRTGSATIDSVDEDAGEIGLDVSDITSFADNDYLFREGEADSAIEGFAAHIPLTAPVLSSDSFRGVDRGVDPRRLAGVRVDDTSTSIEENAGLVAVKISQVGKKANTLVLNPINFYTVARRLNAKITYDGGGNKATYGFEGFDVATAAGVLRAVSDPDCPTNRGYVLNLSTWYWKHLGPWIHFIREGGGAVDLKIYNEDGVESRARTMGNLCCREPGANGVFSIG